MRRLDRIIGQAIGVGLPIAYMEYKHISWEPDRNGKLRMAMKQTGFWGGIAMAIYAGHRYAFRKKTLKAGLPLFVGTALLPVIGYEGMRRLSKKIFPKSKPLAPVEKKPPVSLDTFSRQSESGDNQAASLSMQVVPSPKPAYPWSGSAYGYYPSYPPAASSAWQSYPATWPMTSYYTPYYRAVV